MEEEGEEGGRGRGKEGRRTGRLRNQTGGLEEMGRLWEGRRESSQEFQEVNQGEESAASLLPALRRALRPALLPSFLRVLLVELPDVFNHENKQDLKR